MKNGYLCLLFIFFLLISFHLYAVPASVSDSLVLAELYETCGGKTWTDASHWNTNAPLKEREGLTLSAEGYVLALNLQGKGLSGTVPASLAKLSKLEQLDLSNNNLTGFPSFVDHPNSAQISVDISANRLDFADLEPNYKAPSVHIFKTLNASSQKPRSENQTLSVSLGEDIAFPFIPFEGKYNKYQWQKRVNGTFQNIPYTASELSLNNIDAQKLGNYRCLITNTTVTDMTVVSESYMLQDKQQIFLACDAGPDQVLCSGEATLQGAGVPVPNESRWELVSAPVGGKAVFQDSTKAQTKVSLSKKGTYVFRWYLHGGLENPCWDYVSLSWSSPQAQICEHVLACESQQASFDISVGNGNNQGSCALKLLDEKDQQVLLLTDIPYGIKKTVIFAYDPEHHYRVLLLEKDGQALCLQNPYPLSFSEPQLSLQVDALSKTVCAGEQASFSAQASLSAQGCAAPQSNVFTYKLYTKQNNQLIGQWSPTSDPIETEGLETGSYILRAWPAESPFGACFAEAELGVQPSSLSAQLKVRQPSCQGSADGSALALVTGGDKFPLGQAYRYAWFEQGNNLDTLSTLPSVSALKAGAYRLEVRDAGACNQPPLYVFFNLQDAPPLGTLSLQAQACGALAVLSPAGGEAPYTFAFEEKTQNGYKLLTALQGTLQNNNTVTAQAALPLPATVRVRLTDKRGCTLFSQDTYLQAPQLTSTYNLCFRWSTAPTTVPQTIEPLLVSLPSLEADRMKQAIAEQQSRCLTSTEAALTALEASSCLALTDLRDNTELAFERSEELHTLFLSDRAGRMLASIPPKGVNPLSGQQLSRAYHPDHSRRSTYAYDESGAVLRAQNPDGGSTEFLYNKLGQLRFSQDALQQQHNTAAFVGYDALARTIRSGVVHLNKDYLDPYQNKNYAVQSFEDLKALLDSDEASFEALSAEARYPDASQSTEQVSRTAYGISQNVQYPAGGIPQTHLRNRVSLITVQNGAEPENKQPKTYFSYDVHGNVTWSLSKRHDLPDQYARSEYDLITGKVNRSLSNEGSPSQVWQRYAYDEDGRLLASESSSDGILFERDAAYAFYKHGPLKRILIGADELQGIDLTSTLQGMIKGINHPTSDPALDGEANKVGADAFASVLSYRTNDFVHQNSAFTAKDPLTLLEANHAKGGLVGGWVSREGYGSSGTVYDQIHGRTFLYDKAGRLKAANTKLYNEQSKAFVSTEDYKETFDYDKNGNITALTRNAHGLNGKDRKQDMLTYYYTDNTDRLRHVKDAVGADAWTGDIDDQGEDNYGYDAAGRLVQDKAEGIEQIDWTAGDKVAKVVKSDKTEIRFRYGTTGERIEKTVIPQGNTEQSKSTLYAQGSVYEKKRESIDANTYDEVLTLKEQALAEGMLSKEREMSRIRHEEGKAPYPVTKLALPKAYLAAERGAKTYALKDHLGNVRVTVSDRKLSDLTDEIPSNFRAEVLSIARYDAFGSLQQGRQYAQKSYRYGYNGMEKDEELKGAGNSYDYGARFYDPRLGRWLSTDPKAGAFPAHSPYNFALNNPVAFNDPDGQAPRAKVINVEMQPGKAPNLVLGREYTMPNGNTVTYTEKEVQALAACLNSTSCLKYNPEETKGGRADLAEAIINNEWRNNPFMVVLDMITFGKRGGGGGAQARNPGRTGPRRAVRARPRTTPRPTNSSERFPRPFSTNSINIPENTSPRGINLGNIERPLPEWASQAAANGSDYSKDSELWEEWTRRATEEVGRVDLEFSNGLNAIRRDQTELEQRRPIPSDQLIRAFTEGFQRAKARSFDREVTGVRYVTPFTIESTPENIIDNFNLFPLGIVETSSEKGELYFFFNNNLYLFQGNQVTTQITPENLPNFLRGNVAIRVLGMRE